MKKQLALIAFLAVSGVAFANGYGGGGGGGNNNNSGDCNLCTNDIVLKGPTLQVTVLKNTWSTAEATGQDARAVNNMSSNTHGVLIDSGVKSTQITALKDSGVLAYADAGSYANNNLASNVGEVGVGANQMQIVVGKGAHLTAKATSKARAIQNFSSNNACLECR